MSPDPAPTSPRSPGRLVRSLRAWWRDPHLTWWLVTLLGLLLFLHKPSALVAPQPWAEDGSVFLTQQDLLGWHAFLVPYMGYLHALPCLIAGAAARLLDPAYWPAFTNGAAFLIWLAVIARFFSRRLDLPGKPWLALAVLLCALTPEVLFNITNLQWLTAFVLLQQLFVARPTSWPRRLGDWVLLVLVGLTGPFVLLWLPLFAWRWWRERQADNLAAFGLVGACAAVQGAFILATGPTFAFQAAPFRAGAAAVMLVRRLLVEPLLGEALARHVPPGLAAAAGVALLLALAGWVLRPHPRRPVRMVILAALALAALASAFRIRFDTWPADSFANADRYFFIPRVLLAWLVVWEFDATPRFAARLARALGLVAVLAALPRYVIPAPPDYHWAAQAGAIRRGEPANIPTLPAGWVLRYPGRTVAPPPPEPPSRPPSFLTLERLPASTRSGFAFRLRVDREPARYRATGLPPGLALGGHSGWITGRPERTGTFVARVTAANAVGSTVRDFTFQVDDRPFVASVNAPFAGTAGKPVELQYAAFDSGKRLDFVDITDLMTGRLLGRIPTGPHDRQCWQGRFPLELQRPGRHRINLRFVRFEPGTKEPYTFLDRSVEIDVAPAPP